MKWLPHISYLYVYIYINKIRVGKSSRFSDLANNKTIPGPGTYNPKNDKY